MSTDNEGVKYLRFGVPQRSLRSFNALTGEHLAGTSVYQGWLEPEDEEYAETFFIDTTKLSRAGVGTLVALAAMDRPAFFVSGEQTGVGPDGEPLVTLRSWWRVPKTTDITCNEPDAESALDLWSRGPRDGSGVEKTQWRVGFHEAGYLPPWMASLSLSGNRPMAYRAQGKDASNKRNKRKEQKAARKKGRKKK